VADVRPLPLVRDLKVKHPNPDAYIQFARNTVKAMAKNFPAPAKCVDCVEQSLKARTLRRRHGLRTASTFYGPDAHAREQGAAPCLLRRARRQQDPRRARGHAAAQGRIVAVIGAGTMGGGITMNFLNAGIPVTMLEMKQDALDRGVATIRKNYEAQVKKGKLKQDKPTSSAWRC
jgi:3-hydroxyacyl-CoA dehydrogenase